MNLLDIELVLLDGQCRPEIQKEVDAAKERLEVVLELVNIPPTVAGFIADVVREAKTGGKLSYRIVSLRKCEVCGHRCDYDIYTRYSSNHKKGDKNYDRPIMFNGIDLSNSLVSVRGYATLGCCLDCWKIAQPVLIERLKNVVSEIPEKITGEKPKFKRYKRKKCTECGWVGHEGQMRKLRTLMGDGYYPGGCPKCGVENSFFSPNKIESLNEFELKEQC
jgi:hypothetical protein